MHWKRREMLAGLAASALTNMEAQTQTTAPSLLEVTLWRLHNSAEDQAKRVAAFLRDGLAPALSRSGAQLVGAFADVIGSDGPFYVSVAQFAGWQQFGRAQDAFAKDDAFLSAMAKLSTGAGLPFVRLESSLLKSFDVFPQAAVSAAPKGRSFELRCYESPSPEALRRKVGMFNAGEAKIFERLGMRPVFFGETVVGPKQPNLMYMLSYDNLTEHDRLWGLFGSDPEWQKLRAEPGLSDAEIVANISNTMLRPLDFSPTR